MGRGNVLCAVEEALMSKVRWAKWFWADWSNDTALNLCSLPARGLWMALLCLAAQGEPYGTVTVKGRIPTADELFSLIAPRGTRRRDFNLWMAELQTRGVAQSDQRGAIVSPRMSQEGVIATARIRAAQTRWQDSEKPQNGEDLHEQTPDENGDLHMQRGDFASVDSGTVRKSPDSRRGDSPFNPLNPPKSPRKARGDFPFRLVAGRRP